MIRIVLSSLIALALLAGSAAAARFAPPVDGEFVVRDFPFSNGETIGELRLHYFTLGTPAKDGAGKITNAVLLLHGTGGSGAGFLSDSFGGELFGAGQALDATRWYVIVPDAIGHGKSAKPRDGLRAKFPRYTYADMVEAQYRLLTQGLGIDHLRLLVGTSMGGMHAWMWAGTHAAFMDAVMPIACLPAPVSGRNRMERRMIVEAIRNDPEWKGGEYERQPVAGMTTALRLISISAGSVRHMALQAPTQDASDQLLDRMVAQRMKGADANDLLYAWDASRDYDPGPGIANIRASVLAVNFADDERNPPQLGIMEREFARLPQGKFVLVPASERTNGHASLGDAALWKHYVVELLERSNRNP